MVRAGFWGEIYTHWRLASSDRETDRKLWAGYTHAGGSIAASCVHATALR